MQPSSSKRGADVSEEANADRLLAMLRAMQSTGAVGTLPPVVASQPYATSTSRMAHTSRLASLLRDAQAEVDQQRMTERLISNKQPAQLQEGTIYHEAEAPAEPSSSATLVAAMRAPDLGSLYVAPFPELPVQYWTVAHVQHWLEHALCLPQYRAAFTDAAVDGLLLATLREGDLVNVLGIRHPLHLRKLGVAIAALATRLSVAPPPPVSVPAGNFELNRSPSEGTMGEHHETALLRVPPTVATIGTTTSSSEETIVVAGSLTASSFPWHIASSSVDGRDALSSPSKPPPQSGPMTSSSSISGTSTSTSTSTSSYINVLPALEVAAGLHPDTLQRLHPQQTLRLLHVFLDAASAGEGNSGVAHPRAASGSGRTPSIQSAVTAAPRPDSMHPRDLRAAVAHRISSSQLGLALQRLGYHGASKVDDAVAALVAARRPSSSPAGATAYTFSEVCACVAGVCAAGGRAHTAAAASFEAWMAAFHAQEQLEGLAAQQTAHVASLRVSLGLPAVGDEAVTTNGRGGGGSGGVRGTYAQVPSVSELMGAAVTTHEIDSAIHVRRRLHAIPVIDEGGSVRMIDPIPSSHTQVALSLSKRLGGPATPSLSSISSNTATTTRRAGSGSPTINATVPFPLTHEGSLLAVAITMVDGWAGAPGSDPWYDDLPRGRRGMDYNAYAVRVLHRPSVMVSLPSWVPRPSAAPTSSTVTARHRSASSARTSCSTVTSGSGYCSIVVAGGDGSVTAAVGADGSGTATATLLVVGRSGDNVSRVSSAASDDERLHAVSAPQQLLPHPLATPVAASTSVYETGDVHVESLILPAPTSHGPGVGYSAVFDPAVAVDSLRRWGQAGSASTREANKQVVMQAASPLAFDAATGLDAAQHEGNVPDIDMPNASAEPIVRAACASTAPRVYSTPVAVAAAAVSVGGRPVGTEVEAALTLPSESPFTSPSQPLSFLIHLGTPDASPAVRSSSSSSSPTVTRVEMRTPIASGLDVVAYATETADTVASHSVIAPSGEEETTATAPAAAAIMLPMSTSTPLFNPLLDVAPPAPLAPPSASLFETFLGAPTTAPSVPPQDMNGNVLRVGDRVEARFNRGTHFRPAIVRRVSSGTASTDGHPTFTLVFDDGETQEGAVGVNVRKLKQQRAASAAAGVTLATGGLAAVPLAAVETPVIMPALPLTQGATVGVEGGGDTTSPTTARVVHVPAPVSAALAAAAATAAATATTAAVLLTAPGPTTIDCAAGPLGIDGSGAGSSSSLLSSVLTGSGEGGGFG